MRHNNDLIMRQDAKLAAAKHFRDELQPRKLHKVYHATYSDEVHDVAQVFAGQLVDSNGKVYNARHTLPVPTGSSHIDTAHTRGTTIRAYKDKPDATFPAPTSPPTRPTLTPAQATTALQQASGSPPPRRSTRYRGPANAAILAPPASAPPAAPSTALPAAAPAAASPPTAAPSVSPLSPLARPVRMVADWSPTRGVFARPCNANPRTF